MNAVDVSATNIEGFAPGNDQLGISKAQFRIFMGALKLQEKKMTDEMDPYDNVKYVIDLDTPITNEELIKIRKDGYSRKPVVLNKENRHLVIGVLLTKSLIGIDGSEGKTLK